MEHHPVVRIAAKILIPPILLFGLYVQFHGDFGPGGGFQAGVIFGAAIILYGLVFGLAATQAVIPPKVAQILTAVGVLLYAGVGVWSMTLGGNFLDYDALDSHDPVHGQHLGILIIELGVGITVAAVMTVFFYGFAGYLRERD